MKRSHMNFCKECREAFAITNNVDLCDICKAILDIRGGEFNTEEAYENQEEPVIVKEIMRRYMAFGYE